MMRWFRQWLKRRRDRHCAAGYHQWQFERQYEEEYTDNWNGYQHGPIPAGAQYMIGRWLRFVENRCTNCGKVWRYESYGE